MIDKKEYICSMPFNYTEVFDDRQYLCCPSWLSVDVWDGKSIKSSFQSKKSKEVRESIIDGSYKYCDEKQCPYLSGLKNNKLSPKFIKKDKKTIEFFRNKNEIETVNFCFDRSCNFQCPSCRNELINYYGKDREQVEIKLEEITNEISSTVKILYLTGTADPFYSKSFREFLETLDSKKFSKLEAIHLHTNASLWNEKMWNRLIRIHPYVKTCEISIDAGTKETYETKTRIGGKWDVLLDNLKFITKISTINRFSFSFVVQDTNFREMKQFYDMITNYMKGSKSKFDVFYNAITNWDTYTEEQYNEKNVTSPNHKDHTEFLEVLETMKDLPFFTNNFNHLYEKKKNLI
jgi:organic radical activating enzyme